MKDGGDDMNSIKLTIIAALVCLPGWAFADEAGSFKYTGSNRAKQVCKAAADDDVPKLRLVLRTYRQSLAHSHAFDLDGRELARDFSCNGMDVQVFFRQVGALKVAGFLEEPGQPGDAQVADSGS